MPSLHVNNNESNDVGRLGCGAKQYDRCFGVINHEHLQSKGISQYKIAQTPYTCLNISYGTEDDTHTSQNMVHLQI